MVEPNEATDFPSPEPAAPPPEKEKQYRIYNTSGQTLYVVNSEGTRALRPREFYDLPFSKISFHTKLMVRRGFLRLFEKEEKDADS
jgi:hypothetical protein